MYDCTGLAGENAIDLCIACLPFINVLLCSLIPMFYYGRKDIIISWSVPASILLQMHVRCMLTTTFPFLVSLATKPQPFCCRLTVFMVCWKSVHFVLIWCASGLKL